MEIINSKINQLNNPDRPRFNLNIPNWVSPGGGSAIAGYAARSTTDSAKKLRLQKQLITSHHQSERNARIYKRNKELRLSKGIEIE